MSVHPAVLLPADAGDVPEDLRCALRAAAAAAAPGADVLGLRAARPSGGDVWVHRAMVEIRCPRLLEDEGKKRQRCENDEATQMLSLDVSLDALRHFVEYLYTDRLDGDLAVPLTAELMRLARERWREEGDFFSPGQRRRSPAPEGSPEPSGSGDPPGPRCAMQRLYTLCEAHLFFRLSMETAVEILLVSIQGKSKSLEQNVYKWFAREKPALDISFNRHLMTALKDHPEELAKAIAAAAGNDHLSSEASRAEDVVKALPPPRLKFDLLELLASPGDCRLVAEQLDVSAHRFMLAARSRYFASMLASPMREARTGELPVQTVPTPSKKSIQALLEFLYTGSLTASIESLRPADFMDLLMVLDEGGGENYLQLAPETYTSLRRKVEGLVVAKVDSKNMWMILRRAKLLKNPDISAHALKKVVKKTDFEDAESFQQWCQGRDQGLVWSEQLEVQLLQDVLKQKCKQQQKLKQKLQKRVEAWTLQVEKPFPESSGVYNCRGRRYLLRSDTAVGSACANEIGSISAIFEEEVRATRGHEPFRVGFAHLIDVIYP
ncbi:unnamed protein product [Durusdinium trenchii]|uniref:BTB domain-containing protein n=1 Tax=Durusdinium trenchii TaxID=1381693 RepID=A0ABP0M6G0_9DINO